MARKAQAASRTCLTSEEKPDNISVSELGHHKLACSGLITYTRADIAALLESSVDVASSAVYLRVEDSVDGDFLNTYGLKTARQGYIL